MAQIFDALGVEIKVGDFVVSTYGTNYTNRGMAPDVCTRLSSVDNIQMNGEGYFDAARCVVITEQVKATQDPDKIEGWLEAMREHMQDKPVKKAKPAARWNVVVDFGDTGTGAFMYIIPVFGNKTENKHQSAKFADWGVPTRADSRLKVYSEFSILHKKSQRYPETHTEYRLQRTTYPWRVDEPYLFSRKTLVEVFGPEINDYLFEDKIVELPANGVCAVNASEKVIINHDSVGYKNRENGEAILKGLFL